MVLTLLIWYPKMYAGAVLLQRWALLILCEIATLLKDGDKQSNAGNGQRQQEGGHGVDGLNINSCP